MKTLLVTAAGSLAAAPVFAAPTCNVPEEKCISETYLEAKLQS